MGPKIFWDSICKQLTTRHNLAKSRVKIEGKKEVGRNE